ncbi:FKBP-type peptidyl-prolyl cis-trans isomerase [Metabacillus crassostreae]|uniref:DUF4430 domain-containing protein n=1 Tax=Metabacillus crassostreae TaxID=929098 RepID=UPI00195DAE7C|nr:DUF4430 domain-containing protein [Metabacillus crassostreae]MBM7605898.1 FKBP-type peptidyl-prolyl cis-trans isomerase [Metabacillus crassostreae]
MGKYNKVFLAFMMIVMFLIGCEKDEVVPITEKTSVEETTEASSTDKEVVTDNDREGSQDPTEDSNKEESSQKTTESDKKESIVALEDKQETSSTADTSKEKEASSNKTEKSTERQTSKPAATPEVDEKKKSSTATQTAKTTPEIKTTPKEEETKKEKITTQPVVKKEEPKQTVTITIAGDQEKGTILSSTKVEMSEGNTVLDITKKILKEKGKPISVTGSGAFAYIQGIDGLSEFDRGPLSGWTVKKNGATLDRSAGIVKVKNGDSIQWIYTTNYQEDES